jgi:hypothetical protein
MWGLRRAPSLNIHESSGLQSMELRGCRPRGANCRRRLGQLRRISVLYRPGFLTALQIKVPVTAELDHRIDVIDQESAFVLSISPTDFVSRGH